MQGRVPQLVYIANVRMPTFIGINMILDMHKLTRTLIFSYDFLRFSTFFSFLQQQRERTQS